MSSVVSALLSPPPQGISGSFGTRIVPVKGIVVLWVLKRGGGGSGVVRLCHSEGTHQIVSVIFAICCRLFAQKRLTKGAGQGGGGSEAPQEPYPQLCSC